MGTPSATPIPEIIEDLLVERAVLIVELLVWQLIKKGFLPCGQPIVLRVVHTGLERFERIEIRLLLSIELRWIQFLDSVSIGVEHGIVYCRFGAVRRDGFVEVIRQSAISEDRWRLFDIYPV